MHTHYILLFSGLMLLSLVSAVMAKSLGFISGTRLNFHLKKIGRKPLADQTLQILESCGHFFDCLDQLSRIVMAGALAWWFHESAMHWGDALLISLGFLCFILLVLEAIPDAVSRIMPERLIVFNMMGLTLLGRLFSPATAAYEGVQDFLIRLAGSDAEKQGEQAAEEDILSAVEEGEREGLIKRGGKDMIESIISFYDAEVREVMTPRTAMVCFEETLSLEEGIVRARKCGHSRIPVYRDNKDNIIGILYAKDFLQYFEGQESRDKTIDSMLRKAYFVPESKKVSELFHEFRTQRFHIAIVLDEYGGTLGLVTIEDILEEIVGEIADEFEVQKEDAQEIRRINEKTAEVNGALHVDELNQRLGLELPEDDDYETLAGFLFTRWGRIPAVGEKLRVEPLNFEIIDADERRIKRVRIRK